MGEHAVMIEGARRTGVIAVVLLGLLAGSGSDSPARSRPRAPAVIAILPLSPFADLHSPSEPDYVSYQLKFTYMGPQKKSVASMAAVGTGRAYDRSAFQDYERLLDYGNDRATLDTLVLPPPVFKVFLDAISLEPALTDTTFDPEPNMSLMILRDSGPATKCWEHLATRAQTDQLFQLLRNVVTNPADTATVSSYRRQMAGVRR